MWHNGAVAEHGAGYLIIYITYQSITYKLLYNCTWKCEFDMVSRR